MSRPLRALIIEDNPDDAELLLIALRRAGYDAETRRVDTIDDLRAAFAEPWEIVYSDFQLGSFDALGALEYVRREKKSDVPFLVVSGSIGEDVAVNAMRAGADDYFRKEHLERLGPATARSLRESAARQKAASAERRALEAERELRVEAEAANRLKDEFLLTLSHELRTPLHAIVGWVTLIRERPSSQEIQKRALETVSRAAHQLTGLIDELLDVSRLTTGKLTLAPRTVDLAPLVEAALESVRPAAEARGMRFEASLEKGARVYGDPERLQQVIWNVLANAMKFTPDHGSVSVRVLRDGSRVVLSVSDSGVGIAPEFLPHVFERFRQADGSTIRRHGGLGLGLSIAKEIVELHGGTISAESAGVGRGASFTIRLPTREVSAAEDPVEEKVRPGRSLEDVRVLAVDDDADARALVCATLESNGAVVRPAASVREALDLLRTFKPDVLLSDIGLPDEDGYDLIRAVRAQTGTDGAWFPAVALTAYASAEDVRRATEAGFQVHLAKPVDASHLLSVVDELADWSRKR